LPEQALRDSACGTNVRSALLMLLIHVMWTSSALEIPGAGFAASGDLDKAERIQLADRRRSLP